MRTAAVRFHNPAAADGACCRAWAVRLKCGATATSSPHRLNQASTALSMIHCPVAAIVENVEATLVEQADAYGPLPDHAMASHERSGKLLTPQHP
jgi:hypothetical protein